MRWPGSKPPGVTTIIWPGGLETNFSDGRRADLDYYPEWILAGDGLTDDEFASSHGPGPGRSWDNAVVVSNQPLEPDDASRRALLPGLPVDRPRRAPAQDVGAMACDCTTTLRQLFIGIQVAGPRLGPDLDRQGLPRHPGRRRPTTAQIPACFYLPNDYTCIKDVVLGDYDPAGREGSSAPACYRFAEGKRYLTSEIPGGNATAQMKPTDPCLGFDTGQQINTGTPDPGDL